MKRAANISAILEKPQTAQGEFNKIVSEYHEILRGRMGIPFAQGDIALISLMVVAELDVINKFTGRLGKIDGVNIKASIAKENSKIE